MFSLSLELGYFIIYLYINTYTTGQKFEIFGKHHVNSRIWHFDLLQMAGHQPQINMVTLM